MSEGVFQSLVQPSNPSPTPTHPLIRRIDSCGTGAYHVGDGPDPRTMSTLKSHNIIKYRHRARQFDPSTDFDAFNYILAMDDDNLAVLQRLRERFIKGRGGKEEGVGKVMLYGEFGGRKRRNGKGEVVVDPYYGEDDGFEVAYEQAVRFGEAFLEELRAGRLS